MCLEPLRLSHDCLKSVSSVSTCVSGVRHILVWMRQLWTGSRAPLSHRVYPLQQTRGGASA